MYTKQLPAKHYNLIQHNLDKHIGRKPLENYYQCNINFNGTLYCLQLQFINHSRIIPLQAIKLNVGTDKRELITDQMILGALTELVLLQYDTID